MADPYEIVAVDRSTGRALMENGRLVMIDTWLDCDGDDCDADDAVACVAQLPNGMWACVVLDDFEPVRIH